AHITMPNTAPMGASTSTPVTMLARKESDLSISEAHRERHAAAVEVAADVVAGRADLRLAGDADLVVGRLGDVLADELVVLHMQVEQHFLLGDLCFLEVDADAGREAVARGIDKVAGARVVLDRRRAVPVAGAPGEGLALVLDADFRNPDVA